MTQAELECTPFIQNIDLEVSKSYTNASLDPQNIASPCGLKGTFIKYFS